MRLSTAAVHAGEPSRVANGPVVAPCVQTATFAHDLDALKPGASYGDTLYHRCNNNPATLTLASKIAELEGAELALVTSSGMAAIHTTLMAFLSAGDHLLVQPCLYGGTLTLVRETLPRLGVQVTELTNINDPSTWTPLLRPNTKVIYVETISNPLCEVPDLPAVVRIAQTHKLTSIIDNTFASPVNFRPIQLGFDVVVESATKYLNGHSDVTAGVIAGSKAVITHVLRELNHLGGVLDPHACFLLQRGVKTLALRVQRQNVNALALATALEGHPAVVKVFYPGLPSHPQHELARLLFAGGAGVTWDAAKAVKEAQQLSRTLGRSSSLGPSSASAAAATLTTSASGNALLPAAAAAAGPAAATANGAPSASGPAVAPASNGHVLLEPSASAEPGFGGVLSFELRGGFKAADAFMRSLRLATVAPSLGGVETLVTLPAGSSHSGQSSEVRASLGISDGLVRVACGIEDPTDLLEEFLLAAGAAMKAVA